MVLPEQKAADPSIDVKPTFSSIIESPSYKNFVHVWIDDEGLMKTVSTLTVNLWKVQEGTMKEGEFDAYLDKVLDGEYGLPLMEDRRFAGNAIHSLRRLLAGEPLVPRESHVRGVFDKSGKK